MKLEEFIKFCEENGIFYQSCKIYQGKSGFYDYGSIGTLLKRNFENLWREYFGKLFDNIWEIEPTDIMVKETFMASKHLELFNDPITECRNGHRFRADKLIEEKLNIKAESLTLEKMNEIFEKEIILCPICNEKLSKVKLFNLMFPIFVGPESGNLFLYLNEVKKDSNKIHELIKSYKEIEKNIMYLRPETAQGVYVNFPIEIIIQRNRLPLGLFIIGKAYRNEISPRNALLRMREFTQAELQIFFDIENNEFDNKFEEFKEEYLNVLLVRDRNLEVDYKEYKLRELNEIGLPKFYLYFMYLIQNFYLNILKIPRNRFRFFELSESEKSFYNMYHFDIELYLDELGWVEVGGIHFRAIKVKRDEKYKELFGNKDEILVGYDLWNHFVLSENSNFVVTKDNKKFIPVELELSFGVDRNIFALLWIFYDEEEINGKKRIVLRLPRKLAPIKIAIFPLLENKEEHVKIAKKIYEKLNKKYKCYYDDSGSIGRRYRRQDEIGTPFCITVDDQTLNDNTVTIRDRDSMKQIRVKIEELEKYFENQC